MFRFFETLINPERPAIGAPPSRMWPFFRWALDGAWPILGVSTLASMIVGTFDVLMAVIVGIVVDLAVEQPVLGFWNNNWPILLACFVFIMIIRPLLFTSSAALNAITVAPNVGNMVLLRLNRYTLGQPLKFFEDDFAGRISQKQFQTMRAVVDIVVETINAIVFAATTVLASLLVFGSFATPLIAVIAGWFVVYFLFLRFFLPLMRERAKARAGSRAALSGQIVDTITNVKTVKLFASVKREDQAALGAMRNFLQTAFAWGHMSVFFRLGLFLVAGLLPVAAIGTALLLWQTGSITPGELATVGAISIRLSQMSGWVSWTLVGIFSNLGEVEDGIRSLSTPYDLKDAPDATSLNIKKGEIAFKGVTFRYGRDVGGVGPINLTVKQGEKLALVGPSGAGKTTMLALLQRFYDTEAGAVFLDGQDIVQVTQDSLRSQISMVTQDAEMFNRSAFDNIAYGRPDADKEDIFAAARQAEAHDFILNLQDGEGRPGYKARLGERGVKLSGGQRQRIALARAILKDAPILLLDEATAALDSEVEAQIQTALARVMRGKTVVAIAHRLSTISQMDRIVVMDDGHIVEEGTHDNLLVAGGLYAALWDRQTGGFLNTSVG